MTFVIITENFDFYAFKNCSFESIDCRGRYTTLDTLLNYTNIKLFITKLNYTNLNQDIELSPIIKKKPIIVSGEEEYLVPELILGNFFQYKMTSPIWLNLVEEILRHTYLKLFDFS